MQAQRIRGDTMKEKEEGAKPQKSGFLVRLTALAATAALLLGALTLVVYRDRFNLDALRRWFEYRELETSETGEAEPFTHAGGEQASFAYLKNDNDVQKMVTNLFKATTPKGSQSNDPFWDTAASMLLMALVFYIGVL